MAMVEAAVNHIRRRKNSGHTEKTNGCEVVAEWMKTGRKPHAEWTKCRTEAKRVPDGSRTLIRRLLQAIEYTTITTVQRVPLHRH